MNRREVCSGAVAVSLAAMSGCSRDPEALAAVKRADNATGASGGMTYREFGNTGMKVSEVGFGAWGIGGRAYGDSARRDSLAALAKAEELGCNFVDTAAVYGESEALLGEFLRGRRSKWLVATKFSGQAEGLTKTVESQLARLGTETIDFYQLHWTPRSNELYEEMYRLKRAGKVRYVGVSLQSARDIDYVLAHTSIDGFQVPCSLLDPYPYVARRVEVRRKGVGVIVRSSLKEGFLTGKFKSDVVFSDPNDQRSRWSRERVRQTVEAAEKFRFLEAGAGSMVAAAARYPLSFPETSCVILGTRNESQALTNFGTVAGRSLSPAQMAAIDRLQRQMGLRSPFRESVDRIRSRLGL